MGKNINFPFLALLEATKLRIKKNKFKTTITPIKVMKAGLNGAKKKITLTIQNTATALTIVIGIWVINAWWEW